MNKWLLNIACLYFVFVIGGCVDENIVPHEGNVKVQLFDDYSFPGDFVNENTQISIGEYPLAIPDLNGVSYLNNTKFPYNLRIHFLYSRDYCVFDKLNTLNLNVTPPFHLYNGRQNYCYFNINHPGIRGKPYLLKFISKDIFTDIFQSMRNDTGLSSGYGVRIPITKNSISGKILFFEVSYDSVSHKIISYDKFGEKPIDLTVGKNETVTFTNDDIKIDPPECNFGWDILFPQNIYGYDTKIYLSFKDYSLCSDLLIYEDGFITKLNNYNTTVPLNLPVGFQIKLYNWCEFSVNDQECWDCCEPGESITLDNSTQPLLYFPPNNFSATDTTIFRFGANQPGGVYYFNIFPRNIYIVSKNQISLKELKDNGFIFLPNKKYYWWVEHLMEFNSVDEFVSQPYLINPKYKSRSVSEVRSFTAR